MIIPKPRLSNWFGRRLNQLQMKFAPKTPLQRSNLHQLAAERDKLPSFVSDCPVAQKYLTLLGPLDWEHFPERPNGRAWPGSPPLPRAPFVAAYLIKLDQQKRYMSDLRDYLVQHPALVWVLGFPLVPANDPLWGFDVEASLPGKRHFLSVLRTLDNASLQFLLSCTVKILQQELPAKSNFGQTIALDTKHILAWVQENNPKAFIKKGRYDKNRQPKGDPDCRLGVKRRSNQRKNRAKDTPTPTSNPKPASSVARDEVYWGYASGVVATKIPHWGEFALAEFTQTFDRNDITYFLPLMEAAEARLGFRPLYGAFDAAFDAWYVYEYFDQVGGMAAVPFQKRNADKRQFSSDGLPLCKAGLPMPLKSTYLSNSTAVKHQRARYACPLHFPAQSADACPVNHKNFSKKGCLTTLPTANGARIRHQLDRQSEKYKKIYKQRTATERINSQAKELGIERPKLRNRRSITNQDTLTYILINLRAIQRVRNLKNRHTRGEKRPPS